MMEETVLHGLRNCHHILEAWGRMGFLGCRVFQVREMASRLRKSENEDHIFLFVVTLCGFGDGGIRKFWKKRAGMLRELHVS